MKLWNKRKPLFRLRMRLAMLISPELALMAEHHAEAGKQALAAQSRIIDETDALHARGIKGTIFDYQFWVGWNQHALRMQQRRAMNTLMLPPPDDAS